MKISVEWDDQSKKDLIIVRYLQSYSWEELDAASETIYAMLRSVSHKVNMIAVLNPEIKNPRDGNAMARFRMILTRMPMNLGFYINVGQGNTFSRIFFNTLLKIFPTRFDMQTVQSEAQARELLKKRQQEIGA